MMNKLDYFDLLEAKNYDSDENHDWFNDDKIMELECKVLCKKLDFETARIEEKYKIKIKDEIHYFDNNYEDYFLDNSKLLVKIKQNKNWKISLNSKSGINNGYIILR